MGRKFPWMSRESDPAGKIGEPGEEPPASECVLKERTPEEKIAYYEDKCSELLSKCQTAKKALKDIESLFMDADEVEMTLETAIKAIESITELLSICDKHAQGKQMSAEDTRAAERARIFLIDIKDRYGIEPLSQKLDKNDGGGENGGGEKSL